MSRIVDYYFSMHSPWAYIGHVPFVEMACRHNLTITYRPVSLPEVFSETGGLPVTKRHPARLRYRDHCEDKSRPSAALPLGQGNRRFAH